MNGSSKVAFPEAFFKSYFVKGWPRTRSWVTPGADPEMLSAFLANAGIVFRVGQQDAAGRSEADFNLRTRELRSEGA